MRISTIFLYLLYMCHVLYNYVQNTVKYRDLQLVLVVLLTAETHYCVIVTIRVIPSISGFRPLTKPAKTLKIAVRDFRLDHTNVSDAIFV